jgi:two-component system response regulator YesN
MKVVVVEDEVWTREGLINLLNRFYNNLTVLREAKSGEEGLQLIREVKPDIVITDIKMDPLDGLAMLKILSDEGQYNFKTIILSAYSEFEYAKQAISLGVTEYLIKPIDAGKLRDAIKRVEAAYLKEKIGRFSYDESGYSLETVLLRIITGQLPMDDVLLGVIENTYKIKKDDNFALFCVYLGKTYERQSHLAANTVQSLMLKNRMPGDRILFLPESRMLIFAFIGSRDFTALKEYLSDVVIKKINALNMVEAVFCFSECTDFKKLHACMESIRECLPWAIVLGNSCIIDCSRIGQIRTKDPQYPLHLEKDSIQALFSGDYHAFSGKVNDFLDHFTGGESDPDMIKKYFVRYFMNLLQVLRELHFAAWESIDEQGTIVLINSANTRDELKNVVIGQLQTNEVPMGKKTSLLVQKTLRMVSEYYRTGITLEEVADTLQVSPDHISAQLVRELGINFSTYIRNFRISKAKELLITTDLKLYEVAEKSGYSDAKYFGRVFKEAEGLLPSEYRKKFK